MLLHDLQDFKFHRPARGFDLNRVADAGLHQGIAHRAVHRDAHDFVVGVGRAGLADRHQDLALAHWSVAYNLGDAWAPRLLACYGARDVDERRLRFYAALDDFF